MSEYIRTYQNIFTYILIRIYPNISRVTDSKMNFLILQTFQRIQRNRQSRIRVKLSRRAGKRSDEILEEDIVPEPVSNSHQGQHNDLHHHQFQQSRTKMEQPQSSSMPGKKEIFSKYLFVQSRVQAKGQLILKCLLGIFNSLQNEQKNLTLLQVELFLFIFWEN